MKALRALTVAGGLLLVWQAVVLATGVERFILPPPLRVAEAWISRSDLILAHAGVTLIEIALGLALGCAFGAVAALLMAYFQPARRWLMPALIASQAIPVFALAPILVLWLGYGMASKVAMAGLIIFFPVALAFLDGLRRTEPAWLDLARTMTAGTPRARWAELRHVRAPAALPTLGSGLRVAAGVAPIGAVIGEWVGSSAGLGYLMLHANARMQTDLMFAALLTLAALAVALYYAVDFALRRLLPWQPDSLPSDERM